MALLRPRSKSPKVSEGQSRFCIVFHHLAGSLQQHQQRLQRLPLEFDLNAAPAQFAGIEVHLKDPETD
jgi:hypothetical protein